MNGFAVIGLASYFDSSNAESSASPARPSASISFAVFVASSPLPWFLLLFVAMACTNRVVRLESLTG
jgi:hypothetical protein